MLDADKDRGTAAIMDEGARSALKNPNDLVVIIAAPYKEAEAWVAAGIVPSTPQERGRHEKERARLGFDPITSPHELSSGKSTDKRDAKRTCEEILGGAFKDEPERWQRCWEETPLETLEENGSDAGLAEYTRNVGRRIVPLLEDRTPPGGQQ